MLSIYLEDAKNYFRKEGYLMFLSIILVVITPLDYILYIRWLDGMTNYKWFASSFIFPLFGILFFYLGVLYLMLAVLSASIVIIPYLVAIIIRIHYD